MSERTNRSGDDARTPRCALEDRIVALLVDGDVESRGDMESSGGSDPSALIEHLAGCAICRRGVAGARRVDALVAETTVRPAPADVDAWLTRAVREHTSERVVSAVSSRRLSSTGDRDPSWPAIASAAAAVLIVVGVGAWLVGRRGPMPVGPGAARSGNGPPVAVRGAAQEDAVTVPGEDRVAARAPHDQLSPGPIEEDSESLGRGTIVLEIDAVARSGAFSPWNRGRSLLESVEAEADAWSTLARWEALDRVESFVRLFRPGLRDEASWRETAARQAYARGDLPTRIALLGGGSGAEVALAVAPRAARDHALRSALRRTLSRRPSRVEMTAALRLRSAEFDRQLLAAAGQERASLRAAAVDAVREVAERVDRGALLLELVVDEIRRGGSRDEEVAGLEAVRRAFAGLGEDVAGEVATGLLSQRHADLRRTGLLALGVLAEPIASEVLVGVLHGPRREDAELAAWALGRLPAGSDGLVELRPRREYLSLWKAVLSARRDPVARNWFGAPGLSASERALLEAGGFTPAQIPLVVRLFDELDARPSR